MAESRDYIVRTGGANEKFKYVIFVWISCKMGMKVLWFFGFTKSIYSTDSSSWRPFDECGKNHYHRRENWNVCCTKEICFRYGERRSAHSIPRSRSIDKSWSVSSNGFASSHYTWNLSERKSRKIDVKLEWNIFVCSIFEATFEWEKKNSVPWILSTLEYNHEYLSWNVHTKFCFSPSHFTGVECA